MLLDICGEVEAVGEYSEECLVAEVAEGFDGADELDLQAFVEALDREAECIVESHAADDADQNRAAELFDAHDDDGEEGTEGDDLRHDLAPGAAEDVEGCEVDEGGGVIDDDSRVLETEECDEEADARGDGDAHCGREGIKDLLSETRYGEEDEGDSLHQDEDERIGIGKTEAEAGGVDEEGVEPHAARLCEGEV